MIDLTFLKKKFFLFFIAHGLVSVNEWRLRSVVKFSKSE